MDILRDYITIKNIWVYILDALKEEKNKKEIQEYINEVYGIKPSSILLGMEIKKLMEIGLIEKKKKFYLTKKGKEMKKNLKEFFLLLGEKLNV